MKKILIAVFCFLSLFSKGQVYQSMPQYGYSAHRMSFDSTLQIPTFCGVPTLKSNVLKFGAIAFDSCNNRFYFYNPKTAVWDTIKGGGGSTDTTSLSNRINLKLNISDTTNKWVTSVTKLNDSTIRVIKNTTTTDITLTPNQTVTNATRLITTVYNKSGATITKGSVVYIDGAHSSNLPTIALAKANQENTSAYTYGLVETDITDNSSGTVIQSGLITNLNLPTNTYTDGQTLYLSPTVAGGYTTTKPLAPNHYVAIGTITKAHPVTGTIQIAIRNGFQLDEMSDVSIALVPLDSTILQFSRVDSLWHDVNPTTAMGNRFVKVADSSAMLTKYINLAGTGLTKTSQTIANNLSTGVSGGQSIKSGTGASDTLRIFSTTNATKGKIIFGNSAYDEANNRLGINTTSPATPLEISGNTTATNSAQFGTLGFQSYALNNAWISDNIYFNGTNFIRRATGYGGLFYFQGQEGQFRFASTSTAGTTITNGSSGNGLVSLKTNLNGTFAVGDLSAVSNTYTGAKFIVFGATGNAAIGTATDNGFKLDVIGTARASQFQLSALNTAPATASSTGVLGEIRIVNGFIYVCVATNTWQRAAIATW